MSWDEFHLILGGIISRDREVGISSSCTLFSFFFFLSISGKFLMKLESILLIEPLILYQRGQICCINSLTGTVEVPNQVEHFK